MYYLDTIDEYDIEFKDKAEAIRRYGILIENGEYAELSNERGETYDLRTDTWG